MDNNSRLPVPRSSLLPAHRTAKPPALWQEAAPVVARGAALVAVGLVGEWLLRAVARNAFNDSGAGKGRRRRNTALARPRPEEDPEPGTVTISETLIMKRKVIVRR
jgi:hypothetical protein